MDGTLGSDTGHYGVNSSVFPHMALVLAHDVSAAGVLFVWFLLVTPMMVKMLTWWLCFSVVGCVAVGR